MTKFSFNHEISVILSTYASDKFIKNYYNNILELVKVSNIQLIHVLNEPTTKELFFKDKFLELQRDEGEKNFNTNF